MRYSDASALKSFFVRNEKLSQIGQRELNWYQTQKGPFDVCFYIYFHYVCRFVLFVCMNVSVCVCACMCVFVFCTWNWFFRIVCICALILPKHRNIVPLCVHGFGCVSVLSTRFDKGNTLFTGVLGDITYSSIFCVFLA